MIKASVKTTVKGKKRYEQARRVRTLGGSTLQVGVKKTEAYDDGTLVWEVALYNEFGTDQIPERSFIRSTMKENAALLNRWRKELVGKMVTDNWGEQMVLNTLGYRMAELIRAKVMSDVPPENAESTKERKRRLGVPLRTLVETGKLRDAITYTVDIAAVHEPPPIKL